MLSKYRSSEVLLLVFFLITINLNCIQYSEAEKNFNLGFKNKSEMVYEYNHVDILLLNKLAQEDYSYAGLSLISEGTEIKWVITDVIETTENWSIEIDVFGGSNFNQKVDDFETYVFKNTSDLVHEIFNGTLSILYFLPVNMSKYLQSFNSTIPNPFQNITYSFNQSIIFDYTVEGSNDTLIRVYNDFGLMESYQILYNHTKAFEFKLISFTLKGSDFPIWIIIIIFSCIIVAGVGTVLYLIKKRKNKVKSNSKIDKMLKKIK